MEVPMTPLCSVLILRVSLVQQREQYHTQNYKLQLLEKALEEMLREREMWLRLRRVK
jgi:hypothetical protein